MNRLSILVPVVCLLLSAQGIYSGEPVQMDLLNVMQQELDRSVSNLENAAEFPLYYLQYAVTDQRKLNIAVKNGGLEAPNSSVRRYLDVDLRLGSVELDNTHEIRGGNWRDNYSARRIVDFPLDADEDAIRAALWNETEYKFRKGLERYTKVLANRQVKVEEEDLSNDFSAAEPQQYSEDFEYAVVDTAHWQSILKKVGTYFSGYPFVIKSSASFAVTEETTFMVNSEGSRLKHSNRYIRFILNINGMAEDGMELSRYETWAAASMNNLPEEAEIMATAERLVEELESLIGAPVVNPYIGPAILRNRASGVFFHEIFGHRLEGHRQKSESEGQTFTKMLGEEILPVIINVYDDPTITQFKGVDLRGAYKFDDEGVRSRRITVVEKGVLKNFLTTRSPIENFPESNGHARRQFGRATVARMGNTIVQSDTAVSFDRLREMLIEEIKRQEKPYGLIFNDISGGFTMTGRRGPQAFKVKPLLVTRVYADGSPDEVVRGVDIVGTPLTSFSKILMTADDDAVFNGTCGAESGMVPVSAISPSILVSEIEVEKVRKGQEKPPILPHPGHDKK